MVLYKNAIGGEDVKDAQFKIKMKKNNK